ncbi:MAG: 2-hydroxyacid dehydrogenase [Sphaerochaetaceae bacterium]|nr:2-hydroxyacid dehydrogenase [Spirochaetales bacterium]MDY5499419.1 2-hydroxyacid dehydrogenase [Sphaerochaetaceae bacterium]
MVHALCFDTKSYDRKAFAPYERLIAIDYTPEQLTMKTAYLAKGYKVVIVFVNDTLDRQVIDALYQGGTRLIALRSAGYNNVDLKACEGRIAVVRVPAYSPHAIAEHALALTLALNRHLREAFDRTRKGNFSLDGLEGFDLWGKTAGVIGTGRIGRAFIQICQGLGMRILAYDPFPGKMEGVTFTDLDTVLRNSDVVSLHCPMTAENYHLIGKKQLDEMKQGALLVNTSRGGLVDSEALLSSLRDRHLGGVALDVYENEAGIFFNDNSKQGIKDETLKDLLALPNVLVTSHQAFLTEDALEAIARTTVENILEWEKQQPSKNLLTA